MIVISSIVTQRIREYVVSNPCSTISPYSTYSLLNLDSEHRGCILSCYSNKWWTIQPDKNIDKEIFCVQS